MLNQSGTLYVVATPIGNLEDLSSRARRILAEVDLIAAEDTRHSRKMLTHFGIKTRMKSCHDYNEQEAVPQLLRRLRQGDNLALISDAGTPLICDPGYQLVQAAQENGIRVVPVPGANALISALSVVGMPTDRFIFEGYVPEKPVARKKHLQTLSTETRTMVFYEAPHRILGFLQDAVAIFGEARLAAVARELTKRFETIHRLTLGNLLALLRDDEVQRKGEFVVVIHGVSAESLIDDQEVVRILKILLCHSLAVKDAAAITAEIVGGRKNDFYKLAVQLRDEI